MIGNKELVIDSSNWSKGMSTGSDISDGGFSNETTAVNLIANPGVVYAPAVAVDSDTDTRLTGNAIATCPDMNVISSANRLVVTDDGKAYRYNGTKLDAAGIALTAGKTWAAGFTDIITFGGEAYVSSKEALTRWQNDNTIDAGASWPFSFTTSNVPHPGIVYENNMYWADKNLLLIQSTIGDAVAPTTILTLDSSSVILALGIDPTTGLMLISTTNTLDTSATLPAITRLLWYDGNSPKVAKSVLTEDVILGFHTVSGTTFVGYGKNLGYINGSGVSFLRRLNNVTNVQAELPYKHHFAHISTTLYVLDGLQILAFGEILPGSKKFYYCFKNNTNSNKPTVIGDGGNSKLVFGFATTKFYSFDTMSVASSNTMSLITNFYEFPRPVFLRSAYVEYSDAVTNNDDNRSLSYDTQQLDVTQSGYQILRVQGTTTGGGLKNSSGSSVFQIENIIGFPTNKVRWIKFRYNSDTTNFGLARIIIYYDFAE